MVTCALDQYGAHLSCQYSGPSATFPTAASFAIQVLVEILKMNSMQSTAYRKTFVMFSTNLLLVPLKKRKNEIFEVGWTEIVLFVVCGGIVMPEFGRAKKLLRWILFHS